jgi:uncharacterized membrane protein
MKELLKMQARAEFFGFLLYLKVAAFCAVSAIASMETAWLPMLAVAFIVASCLASVHWRERKRILKELENE